MLIPGVLRLETETPALIACAERVRDSMSREIIAVSVDDFRAYADLRDALMSCRGQATEDLLDAVDAVIASPVWAERAGWCHLPRHREDLRIRLSADTQADAEIPGRR